MIIFLLRVIIINVNILCVIRAVDLGITAEDLIVAEQDYDVRRSPRVIVTADSDTEDAKRKVRF